MRWIGLHVGLEDAIISEKKSECFTDNVTSTGVDEFRVGLKMGLGFVVDSEITGQKIAFGLWLDSRSSLSLSHS